MDTSVIRDEYELDCSVLFGRKMSVCIEYVISESSLIVTTILWNWLWNRKVDSREYRKSDIDTLYEHQKDKMYEEIIVDLTQKLQQELIEFEGQKIMRYMRRQWVELSWVIWADWEYVQIVLFDREDPARSLILWFEEGDVVYYFEDNRIPVNSLDTWKDSYEVIDEVMAGDWFMRKKII